MLTVNYKLGEKIVASQYWMIKIFASNCLR